MHVVILGCGRVGSALALGLLKRGHTVAVVDQDPAAFARLSDDFAGEKVVGVGFDRDTLREAGIERAGAFAAVSSGDNSNIIAARVARETFGIDRVVARIYDPRRAEVYERLGIPTVATVRWTANQMLRRLMEEGFVPEWSDPSGQVLLAEVVPDTGWIGRRLTELEEAASVRIVSVSRLGESRLPEPRTVVQEGDLLHVAMLKDRAAEVSDVLRGHPEGGQR